MSTAKTALVKMDQRDHKILLAMMSNLESFIKDADLKAKNAMGVPTYRIHWSIKEEKTFNFQEVFLGMQGGEKFRHVSWPEKSFIYLDAHKVLRDETNATGYMFTPEEINGKWLQVEP